VPTAEDARSALTAMSRATGSRTARFGRRVLLARTARRPVRVVQLSDGKVLTNPTDAQREDQDPRRHRHQRPHDPKARDRLAQGDALNIFEETTWPADASRSSRSSATSSKSTASAISAASSATRRTRRALQRGGVRARRSGRPRHQGAGRRLPRPVRRGRRPQRTAWEEANRKPQGVPRSRADGHRRQAGADSAAGQLRAADRRVIEAIHQADEDYKTTAGFHDASLAERGPQESGKAILARQRQDELGSSHYLDNLRFALCAIGRQLMKLIPRRCDVPTVIRITGQRRPRAKVMVFSGAENDPRNEKFLQTHTGPAPLTLPNGHRRPAGAEDSVPAARGREGDLRHRRRRVRHRSLRRPVSGTRATGTSKLMRRSSRCCRPEIAMRSSSTCTS
jgi:hypothetical protein